MAFRSVRHWNPVAGESGKMELIYDRACVMDVSLITINGWLYLVTCSVIKLHPTRYNTKRSVQVAMLVIL